MNADGIKQREWIDAARAATNAREVKLHEAPRWAREAIKARAKADGIPAPLSSLIGGHVWAIRDVDHFLLAYDGNVRLFDHWGTSEIRAYGYSGPSLVAEPYAGRAHVEAALRFADWLGCDVEIGRASWWFPNHTTRFEFYPRPIPTPEGVDA